MIDNKIALEKVKVLLENNPEQAKLIWQTFITLLDCVIATQPNGIKYSKFVDQIYRLNK